jgi:hypothetical protein
MVPKGGRNQIGSSGIRGNRIPFQTYISCRPPFHPTHAGDISAVCTNTLNRTKLNPRSGTTSRDTHKAHDEADNQDQE